MIDTHLKNNYIDWIPIKEDQTMLVLSEDMEPLKGMWDYIVVSDVFARVPALFSGNTPYALFFEQLKEHLNPGGHVILAADNRYGLQYFAGCRERLTGKYFEGLEGYQNSRGVCTFSRDGIVKMAKRAGFLAVKTYYPYPNYRYLTALYTDDCLPSQGELNRNLCNFEEERMVLFDEAAVFDGLIREGKFREFSNSYLFDLTLEEQEREEELLFVKYSVERDEKYRIKTEIVKKADGTKVVRKIPLGEGALSHVENMKHWEELLKEQYRSAGVSVNRCTLTKQGAEFEFLNGRTLKDLLDECLAADDLPGFFEEIQKYRNQLESMLNPKPFRAGEEFREIFGDITFPSPQTAAELSNIDLIFSNIILKAGKWNVIDYEWTFPFAIPLKFIVYRGIALYCGEKGRKHLQTGQVCRMAGITEEEEEIFREMERRLQVYLLGETRTMMALQQEYSGKLIRREELLHKAHQPEMKVYQDFGGGFSEENSYVLESEEDFYGRRRFTLPVLPGVRAMRLDPCEEACMVTVNRILGECGGIYDLEMSHNGKGYEKSILYTTKDPQIYLRGIVPGTGQIHVDLTVEYLKEDTSYGWMRILERAEKCDRIENSKPYRILRKIKSLVKKG